MIDLPLYQELHRHHRMAALPLTEAGGYAIDRKPEAELQCYLTLGSSLWNKLCSAFQGTEKCVHSHTQANCDPPSSVMILCFLTQSPFKLRK